MKNKIISLVLIFSLLLAAAPVFAAEKSQVFASDAQIEAELSGTAALAVYNGAAWIEDKKVILDNKPFSDGGKIYAPSEFYEMAYGVKTTAENGKIYIGGAEADGKISGDVIYPEFNSAAAALGKNSFCSAERGFAIMGSKSFESYANDVTDYNGNNYLVLSRGELAFRNALSYLLYERPTAEQVISAFNKTSAGVHPRIMGRKADFDRVRSEIKTDAYKSKWAKSFIKNADQMVENPKTPEYVLYDGERMSSETGTRAITLAFAYQLTGNPKYPEAAYREIMIVRDFPDWHPQHFLDTAGMSAGVAIAYDWCYDYWSKEQRENIKDALYRHGLKTGYDDLYGGKTRKWTAWNNNWSAVCWGSLAMSAAALMDDYPEIASEVVSGAVKGIEYMLPMFAPDGAWAEGASYWNYCTTYFTRCMATFESAFGDTWGILQQEGIRETMLFPYTVEGPGGIFNYHDCGGGKSTDKSPNSYFSKYFADDKIKSLRMYEMKNAQNASIDDFLYLDTGAEAAIPENLPLDIAYRQSETGIMRASWTDTSSSYVGYHCGPNSPVHRNFDSGTFIFDSLGVRWAEELGSDSYVLPNYWATENNPIYRVRTEGQNCYVFNPSENSGQRFESEDKILRSSSGENTSFAVMDITDAYADYVNSAQRGIMLTNEKKALIVRDEIDIKESSSFYWFMHTRADISVSGNSAVLTRGGKRMNFEFSSNHPLTLSVMDAAPLKSECSPNNTANTGVKKLVISGEAAGELNITVKIYPDGKRPENELPLALWNSGEGHSDFEINTFSGGLSGLSLGNITAEQAGAHSGVFGRDDSDVSAALVPSDDMEKRTSSNAFLKSGEVYDINGKILHVGISLASCGNNFSSFGLGGAVKVKYTDENGEEKINNRTFTRENIIRADGGKLYAFGNEISAFKSGRWYSIDVFLNTDTNCETVYVNGETVLENAPIAIKLQLTGKTWDRLLGFADLRLDSIISSGKTENLYFDDLRIGSFSGGSYAPLENIVGLEYEPSGDKTELFLNSFKRLSPEELCNSLNCENGSLTQNGEFINLSRPDGSAYVYRVFGNGFDFDRKSGFYNNAAFVGGLGGRAADDYALGAGADSDTYNYFTNIEPGEGESITVEVDFLAENTDEIKGSYCIFAPWYNGGKAYNMLFVGSGGRLFTADNSEVGKILSNRWNSAAAVFTKGEKNAELYINGEKTAVFELNEPFEKIYRFKSIFPTNTGIYLDNCRWYSGGFDAESFKADADGYISVYDTIVLTEGEAAADFEKSGAAFSGSDLAERKKGVLSDGNVILLKSNDGRALHYYTVSTARFGVRKAELEKSPGVWSLNVLLANRSKREKTDYLAAFAEYDGGRMVGISGKIVTADSTVLYKSETVSYSLVSENNEIRAYVCDMENMHSVYSERQEFSAAPIE